MRIIVCLLTVLYSLSAVKCVCVVGDYPSSFGGDDSDDNRSVNSDYKHMCLYLVVCGSRVPEKLLIPPPIPHPAHISVIIHNREAAEPIPLDAPLTLQVCMHIYL